MHWSSSTRRPPSRYVLLVDGVEQQSAAWPATLASRVPHAIGESVLPQIAPHVWDGESRGHHYRIEAMSCLGCSQLLAIPEHTSIILHDACMGMAMWDPKAMRWVLIDGEIDDSIPVVMVSTVSGLRINDDNYPLQRDQIDRSNPPRWILDF